MRNITIQCSQWIGGTRQKKDESDDEASTSMRGSEASDATIGCIRVNVYASCYALFCCCLSVATANVQSCGRPGCFAS